MRLKHKLARLGLVFVLFSPATYGQQLFFQHFEMAEGIPNALIMTVEWTNDDVLWVGTSKGLYYMKGQSKFKAYHDQSLHNAFITRTDENSKEVVWLATSDGRLYENFKGSFSQVEIPEGLQTKLTSRLIDYYVPVGRGKGYISTLVGGEVYYFDHNGFIEIVDSLSTSTGYFIQEFKDDYVICGKYPGGKGSNDMVVRLANGNTFSFAQAEVSGYSKNIVRKLSHGRYVYTRGREVIIFNSKGVHERKFYHAPVQVLMEDDEGKLWIGFAEGGLSCFPSGEISTSNFSRYFDRQSVYDITMDAQGDLWFATSTGLYALPKMPDPTYTPPVYATTTDEKIIKEGANELPAIPTISYTRPTVENVLPEVSITRISINGIDTMPSEVFQLGHTENFISIEFAGLVNNRPGAVQYKYKLDGFDTAWIYTNSNEVVYQALKPGTYVFRVHAQHKSGTWSTFPARTTIIISSPFWRAPWFILLSAFLFITLAVVVILSIERARKKRRVRDEDLKKQLMRSELQALRAQMNPHFTFNTLSSIQNFISQNDVPNATSYLSKFAKLMRMIMENSRMTDVPLNDELKALTLYVELEALRMKNKFEYQILVDEEIDQQYTRIPSMLIQPFVENAIWHGFTNLQGQGKLTIEIKQMGNHLNCVVEDNGIGREAAMKISSKKNRHISKGMSITSERLELLNSMSEINLSVKITDKINGHHLAAGTKVEIFIPLKNE